MRVAGAGRSGGRRLLNVVVALVGIILLAPLMLVIALLIKLTSNGPVLYTQPRVGIDRRRRRSHEAQQLREALPGEREDAASVPMGAEQAAQEAGRDESLAVGAGHVRADAALPGPGPEADEHREERRGRPTVVGVERRRWQRPRTPRARPAPAPGASPSPNGRGEGEVTGARSGGESGGGGTVRREGGA